MNAEAIRAHLPWNWPFLMLDRMVDCSPHDRIVTEKNVTGGDGVIRGGDGWFPAVLLLEGLGQSAALLFKLSYEGLNGDGPLMLGYIKARVHGSARAGAVIRFEVRSTKMTRRGGVFDGTAHVERSLLAEAQLALAAPAGEGHEAQEQSR